jgi:protein TonB
MALKKNPKYDLKAQYKKVIELTLVLALLICIVLFQAFKKFDQKELKKNFELDKIQAEDIPQTQQEKIAPPPARPAIPIESESEDIPDDVTIDDTEIDFDELPPPPPPPPDDDAQAFLCPTTIHRNQSVVLEQFNQN